MTTVQMPDGTLAEVEDREIVEERMPWSSFKLEDGTVFKVKLEILHVTRAVGKFDKATGNPTYYIKSNATMRQSSPPKLKAKSIKATEADTSRPHPEVG